MTLTTLEQSSQIFSIASEFSISLTIILALILDKIFGEARYGHYLIFFGKMANALEAKLNNAKCQQVTVSPSNNLYLKCKGLLAWIILVLPVPTLYFIYCTELIWYWQVLADGMILYLAIGLNSLHQHAMQIYRPLQTNKLAEARKFTGYIVSRETQHLSETDMSRATVESMLENGHDSVIASIFYYAIGGAPLMILHRFANTLDAMWGYKNQRFYHFGFASAKLDDLLGFLSGKCCTLLYALQGLFTQRFAAALNNAAKQGNRYKSHNGGWVMAAGATVMNRTLGGEAFYHGEAVKSTLLGCGKPIAINDIPTSLTIVNRASTLLLCLVFTWQLVYFFMVQ